MLVASAIGGGRLTFIANAFNPAAVALLKRGFADGAISADRLLPGALGSAMIAAAAFMFL